VDWKNGSTVMGYSQLGRGTKPKFTNKVYNTSNQITQVANPTKADGSYAKFYWDGWLTEENKAHETDVEPAD
jgi:hypothetical protein